MSIKSEFNILSNSGDSFGDIIKYLRYNEIGILSCVCTAIQSNELMSLWKAYFKLYLEFIVNQGGIGKFVSHMAGSLAYNTMLAIIYKTIINDTASSSSSNVVRELFSKVEIHIRYVIASFIPLIPMDKTSYQEVLNCNNKYNQIDIYENTLLSVHLNFDAINIEDAIDIDDLPISIRLGIHPSFTVNTLYTILFNIFPTLAEKLVANGIVISKNEPCISVHLIHGSECIDGIGDNYNTALIIPQGYPFSGELTMRGYYNNYIENFDFQLFNAEVYIRDTLLELFDNYHNGGFIPRDSLIPYYFIFNKIIANLPKSTCDTFSIDIGVIDDI